MLNSKAILVILAGLVSQLAWADIGRVGMRPYGSLEDPTRPALDNRLYVDAAPLAAGGIGAGFDHVFTPQLTFGPYISYFNLKTNNTGYFKDDTQVVLFGARGKWFFLKDANRSGPYLTGSLGAINVSASTDFTAAGYSTASSSAKVQATSFGWIAGAGYQFLFGEVFDPNSKWLINLGAQYGTGYAVRLETAYDYINGASVRETANGSVFFDASFGVAF